MTGRGTRKRGLMTVGAVAAMLGGPLLAAGPAAAAPRAGSLRVVVSGLPAGQPAAVVVSRAGRRSVRVRATRVLKGLAPGRWRVAIRPVTLTRTRGAARAGARILPRTATRTVTVRPGRRTLVTAAYGSVVNPGVRTLGGPVAAVTGDPRDPAALTVPAATAPPVGTVLTSGPTAQFPAGLVARVTATEPSTAGTTVVRLAPAAITDALPNLRYDGPIALGPGARARTASPRGLGLDADLNIAGDCGLTSGFELSPIFDFGAPHLEADIRTTPWGGGPKADVLVVSRPTVGVRAQTKDGVFCDREIAAPTTVVGAVVVGVPPVVVVIPVYLSLPFRFRVELTGETDARTTISWTAKVGMRTRRVGRVLIPRPAFEASDPSLAIDVRTQPKITVEPSVGVELGLGARGALDIHVSAQTGLRFTAQPGTCAWDWRLGTFKAEAKAGPLTLGTPEATAVTHRLWTGCGDATFQPTPTAPTTPADPAREIPTDGRPGFGAFPGDTAAQLVAALGPPDRSVADGQYGCTRTWDAIGVTARLTNYGQAIDACTEGYFDEATITSPAWRTTSGLTVGAPEARVQQSAVRTCTADRLYCSAKSGYVLAEHTSECASGRFPGVLANVDGGVVRSFTVLTHGCE